MGSEESAPFEWQSALVRFSGPYGQQIPVVAEIKRRPDGGKDVRLPHEFALRPGPHFFEIIG